MTYSSAYAAKAAGHGPLAGDMAVSSTDDQMIAEYLNRLEAAAAILPPDRRAELIDEISTHIAEARAALANAQSGAADSAAAVLARLGSPEDIVQAAADQGGTGSDAFGPGAPASSAAGPGYGQAGFGQAGSRDWSGPPPGWRSPPGYGTAGPYGARQGLGWMEVVAIVLLLIGGFLAGIGWIVGVILLWLSPRWRVSDKLLGTLVWPGGLAAVLLVLGAAAALPLQVSSCSGGSSCGGTQPGWLGPALAVVAVIVGVAGPVLVTIRLVRQAHRWAGQLPGDPDIVQPL
jgi:hypothetical protein